MRFSISPIDHRKLKFRVSLCLALMGAACLAFSLGTAGAKTLLIPNPAPKLDPTNRVKNCVPIGMSTEEWSNLCAAHEVNKYAASVAASGFLARNIAQQWKLRFDGKGFDATPDCGGWSWGLELICFGRAGTEQSVSFPTCAEAIVGRVSYEWDGSLTEWYVNESRGLEHGYTLNKRPSGDQHTQSDALLQFRLAVRGELIPQISADGRSVVFVNDSGAHVINYSGLTVIDANGDLIPAWFETVNSECQLFPVLQLNVDDRHAQYPVTIDPIAQQAYLKASNTGVGDLFGWSIAMSGDTVVVGAPAEDSNATGANGDQADNTLLNAGAVYVFVRNGTSWTQQAYLKASNPDGAAPSGDEFGSSVDISGDTLVVGAQGEDSNATGINGNQSDNSASEAGAAYVFVRTGTTWAQQAYLKSTNMQAGDIFGVSVAVSGDTVVVGAAFEDSNATGVGGNQADNSTSNSGAAYVFVRSGSSWSQQAYLKASNTGANDSFGWSVALSGDTVVVGAHSEDSNATGVNGNQANNSASGAGAAYVFIRSGTSWSQQAYLKASNAGADDNFGRWVGVSDDTLVIGAYLEDSNAIGVNGNQTDNSLSGSGAAYVFVRNLSNWSQQAYLKASNPGSNDHFGLPVAISGDMIAVGATGEDSNATGLDGNQADNSTGSAGAGYVFSRIGTIWNQIAYIKASNTGASDFFGSSLAISGNTFAIGAPFERSNATGVDGNQADNSVNNAGAAYVFAEVAAFLLGDMSCDGEVDSADIAPFIMALLDPSAACNILNGDILPDGHVDGGDVQPFVNLLIP